MLAVETSGLGWSWGDAGAGLARWRCWEWVGGGDVRAGLVSRGTQEWVSLGGDIRGGLVWLGTWAGAGVGEDTAFGLVLVGTPGGDIRGGSVWAMGHDGWWQDTMSGWGVALGGRSRRWGDPTVAGPCWGVSPQLGGDVSPPMPPARPCVAAQ